MSEGEALEENAVGEARRGEDRGEADALVRLLARPGPIAISSALGARLAEAYRTPRRAYHHLGHVVEVMGWFDWAAEKVRSERGAENSPWRQPREVAAAILFHDAIYVAGAKDNEARSAELARQAAGAHAELSGLDTARVAALIELTARHGKLAGEVAGLDEEARRFLDCDMAILAASPARYQRYVDEIREEYAAIPVEAYRAGRRAFVQGLLAAPRIYLSELFFAELEARARENLRGEMAGASDSA